jgi:hypothetical protein
MSRETFLRHCPDLPDKRLRLIARPLKPVSKREIADPEKRHREEGGRRQEGTQDVHDSECRHTFEDHVQACTRDRLETLAYLFDIRRKPGHQVADVGPGVECVWEPQEASEDLLLQPEQDPLTDPDTRVGPPKRDRRKQEEDSAEQEHERKNRRGLASADRADETARQHGNRDAERDVQDGVARQLEFPEPVRPNEWKEVAEELAGSGTSFCSAGEARGPFLLERGQRLPIDGDGGLVMALRVIAGEKLAQRSLAVGLEEGRDE